MVGREIRWREQPNGCWHCTSHHRNREGYPIICRNYKTVRLSRFMYAKYCGEIPDGLVMRHLCNDPRCINPFHLTPGTQRENVHDKKLFGTWQTGENHPNHKLTDSQIDEIRSMRNLNREALSRMFGISIRYVYYLLDCRRHRLYRTGGYEK